MHFKIIKVNDRNNYQGQTSHRLCTFKSVVENKSGDLSDRTVSNEVLSKIKQESSRRNPKHPLNKQLQGYL